ncbi:unnamed protein product, partial [Allacma fusca]
RTLSRDILVLTLKTPVEYNDYVQPLRLAPADSNPVDGQVCTAIGWGFMGNNRAEENLQVANLTFVTVENCLSWSFDQPFVVNEYSVCTKPVGEHHGQPDKGDSGGPMMCYDEKVKFVDENNNAKLLYLQANYYTYNLS